MRKSNKNSLYSTTYALSLSPCYRHFFWCNIYLGWTSSSRDTMERGLETQRSRGETWTWGWLFLGDKSGANCDIMNSVNIPQPWRCCTPPESSRLRFWPNVDFLFKFRMKWDQLPNYSGATLRRTQRWAELSAVTRGRQKILILKTILLRP